MSSLLVLAYFLLVFLAASFSSFPGLWFYILVLVSYCLGPCVIQAIINEFDPKSSADNVHIESIEAFRRALDEEMRLFENSCNSSPFILACYRVLFYESEREHEQKGMHESMAKYADRVTKYAVDLLAALVSSDKHELAVECLNSLFEDLEGEGVLNATSIANYMALKIFIKSKLVNSGEFTAKLQQIDDRLSLY